MNVSCCAAKTKARPLCGVDFDGIASLTKGTMTMSSAKEQWVSPNTHGKEESTHATWKRWSTITKFGLP